MELWLLIGFAVLVAVIFGVRLQRQWDADAPPDDAVDPGFRLAAAGDDPADGGRADDDDVDHDDGGSSDG